MLCGTQIDGTKWKQASLIEDSNGKLLTKDNEILRRWQEYSEELYNYELRKDLRVLEEPTQTEERREEEDILLSEVECAIKEL